MIDLVDVLPERFSQVPAVVAVTKAKVSKWTAQAVM